MVSVPKMPANSSARRAAAVRRASCGVEAEGVPVRGGHDAFRWSGCRAGEVVDAAVEVGEGGFERRVGVEGRRVGDRPVQPGQVRVEFFVGVVADGDDEVGGIEPVVECGRSGVGQVQAVAGGDGDGAGVDSCRRVGAGGDGRDGAEAVPGGGGELGAGGVGAADEHHPARRGLGGLTGQGGADDGVVEAQLDVAAAPVALGADPPDHPGGFEHLEVVGEQVGAQAERLGEVAGGGVAGDELIGQGEADRFTERRVHRGPLFERSI